MDPRTRTHRRLHLVPGTPGRSPGNAGRPPGEPVPAEPPYAQSPYAQSPFAEPPLTESPSTQQPPSAGTGAADLPATDPAATASAPSRPQPGSPAEPSWSAADPLTDHHAAGCTDAGLVAEIRACEASRHRLLHDQLILLTEARRRGIRLPAGPSSELTGGTPT
ncbi:hypothetical protein ABZ805_00945 [Saccharopolyspora sp. NPDC047091]|uniref:hypothetical protein n=1 Tax=Saccharopolyspora sp. NPDC047091 TaxID=3155924 RepID=UPI0033EAB9AD